MVVLQKAQIFFVYSFKTNTFRAYNAPPSGALIIIYFLFLSIYLLFIYLFIYLFIFSFIYFIVIFVKYAIY
jgi:hypothetical protein